MYSSPAADHSWQEGIWHMSLWDKFVWPVAKVTLLEPSHPGRSSRPCIVVPTFAAKPQSSVFQSVTLRLSLAETPGEGLLNL